MADREQTARLYTKHRQHKNLRQDPKYRQKKEKTKKERERVLEDHDAEQQIKEFLK